MKHSSVREGPRRDMRKHVGVEVPGLKAKPKPIKSVGIIGSGLMGGGIAMCCIQKGLKVEGMLCRLFTGAFL